MPLRYRIFYASAVVVLILLIVADLFHVFLIEKFRIHEAFFHPIIFIPLLGVIALIMFLVWSRSRAEIHRTRLDLDATKKELDFFRSKNRELIEDVKKAVNEQYKHWGFSESEFEVANLLIRGSSTKQIAAMMQKSEGTVRNQTLAIYRKSGMTGRNDLAAFFLNEFIGEDE